MELNLERTELVKTVRKGDVEGVRILLQAGEQVNEALNLALIIASRNSYTEIALNLLLAGADVHSEDDDALCWAAEKGNMELVQILLKAGADIHGQRDNPLRLAAYFNHTQILELLLSLGGDVHAHHDRALRYALIYYGQLETIRILLQAGADVHAKDEESLRFAVEKRDEDKIRLLLQYGGNFQILSSQDLAAILTPDFVLFSPAEVLARMETSHPLIEERYHLAEKRNTLESTKKEIFFDIRILLADMYYRPGEPAACRAVALF